MNELDMSIVAFKIKKYKANFLNGIRKAFYTFAPCQYSIFIR